MPVCKTLKIPAGTGQGNARHFSLCVCARTCARLPLEVSLVFPQLKSSTLCQIHTGLARDAPCRTLFPSVRARWSEEPKVQKGGCRCWGWEVMLPGDQLGPGAASVLLSGFSSLAAPVFVKAGSSCLKAAKKRRWWWVFKICCFSSPCLNSSSASAARFLQAFS